MEIQEKVVKLGELYTERATIRETLATVVTLKKREKEINAEIRTINADLDGKRPAKKVRVRVEGEPAKRVKKAKAAPEEPSAKADPGKIKGFPGTAPELNQ